jgi:hypothetical protein
VEAVIDYCAAFRKPVVHFQLTAYRKPFGAKGHMIHYAGGAAAGRRHRSGIEIIGGAHISQIQIHMGVDINAAGKQYLALAVNNFLTVKWLQPAHFLYSFAFDTQIANECLSGNHKQAAF